MKTIVILILLQTVLLAGGAPTPAAPPAFEDYPVESVSEKKLEFIDWPSHPDAWRYRTRLRAALGKPPDFAARYVVVLIGCGTCCEWVALIDVETGRVHFAPFATSLGSSYRADSRLFINSPPDEVDRYYRDEPDMPRTVFQTNHYVWDESRRSFEPVISSGSAPATRPRPVKSSENAVQAVCPDQTPSGRGGQTLSHRLQQRHHLGGVQ